MYKRQPRAGTFNASFGPATITAPATEAARAWDGWGTALKPGSEHWILVRKPLDGTVAANCLKWGTGGLNIDACRLETAERLGRYVVQRERAYIDNSTGKGRWPANVAFSDEAAEGLNQQSDGASRFFYCPKAPKRERSEGLAEGEQNRHPTVKAQALMEWLCRLVTPPEGLVLDPFAGSGSTGVAALRQGFRFVGIEREQEYAEVARARLDAAANGTGGARAGTKPT